ncbi:MAG: EFR1 family ferrodoxin [Deltaproteobacteria bacterium]|nr:EFR1 family ferrodoxin [Deltaproteobacteria bacterium]
MDATIFYYTGTGNSLWVARSIARELRGARLLPISGYDEKEAINAETIGMVFPVHIWGVPAPVIRFVKILEGSRPAYIFACAVHAGQVSNTLVQLKKVMADSGLALSAGFEIRMPSNYIPWGGPGPQEKQRALFTLAREKISRVAAGIRNRAILLVERGPFWQRIIFTAIYNLSFSRVPGMDKKFWADDRCNACGICLTVCPARNITLHEGKPLWDHRCDQCFACLQWCPQEAIQYGTRTPRYQRYHHPEVFLKDMLNEEAVESGKGL